MTAKPNRDEIHRALREQILLLDLPPGAALREQQLAARFGVSRTPIRQVLDRLEFEGLVEQADGRGARVSTLDPKRIRDIWAVRLRITELVGDFVRLPAPPPILERVTEIRSSLDTVRDSRDLRELGGLYNRFHEVMLELVNNEALVLIQDLLYVQVARVWLEFLPEMDLDREIDVMAEEVDQVLQALKGSSGHALSSIRSEHMGRLLGRFNQHVTMVPAVPA